MTSQEKVRLMRLIECLGGAASVHLHALFFAHQQPARMWDPARREFRAQGAVGTCVESARRRLSFLQRRGDLKYFTYGRPHRSGRGCRAVAIFLTPLAYMAHGEQLRLRQPQKPSDGLARRGWQRGEIWAAFAAHGAICAPHWLGQGASTALAPFDVVSHAGRDALVLVDMPELTCEQLVHEVPVSKGGKQPIMVVPSADGSIWDASTQSWHVKGTRLREIHYLLEQRGDCAAWYPRQVAGAGMLTMKPEAGAPKARAG